MTLFRVLGLSLFLSCLLGSPALEAQAQVPLPESSPATVGESGEVELVAPVASAPSFSLIYEGATGGISGAGAGLDLDSAISAALAGREGAEWSRLASGWGAYLREGSWLVLPQGEVSAFGALAGAPLTAGAESAVVPGLLADDYVVVVWPPAAAAELTPLLAQALASDVRKAPPAQVSFAVAPYEGDQSSCLHIAPAASEGQVAVPPLAFPTDALTWEARLRSSFVAQTEQGLAQIYLISRVQGEGARRAAMIAGWADSPSLYLAAGETVEGRSYLSGQTVSLQRPITWAKWAELGLTALAPAEAELAAGVDELKAEATAAGVKLVSANLIGNDGSPVFAPWVIEERAGKRVALIGWTRPAVYPELPQSVRSQLHIEGIEAVQRAVEELRSGPAAAPDLVVLFGAGARDVAGDLAGVDIVLGDFSTRHHLASAVSVGTEALKARADEHPMARAPALVSRLGAQLVGKIDVSFDEASGAISGLQHARVRIAESLPADPASLRAVQEVRQGVYASLDAPLVPDLEKLVWPKAPKGYPEAPVVLDRGTLTRLSANLLMDRTGADLALLRPLPKAVSVPGETSELYIDAALAVLDDVVVIELTGAQLKAVFRVIEPVTPQPGAGVGPVGSSTLWGWVAGAERAGIKIRVRGRLIGDADIVRVATSDFFADDPALASAIKKARVMRHFGAGGWARSLVGKKSGSAWRLHDLVKDGLALLRDGGESEEPAWSTAPGDYAGRLRPLLTDQATQRSGRLTFEFDDVALQVTGSVPLGSREGYGAASESRVHQELAGSISARGHFGLVWSDRRGQLKAYADLAFGEQRTPESAIPTELEDDFELGLEGQLRIGLVPFPEGKVLASGFVQGAFDTEFTPSDELADLQQVLRLTGGLTLGRYQMFRALKAGFFLEYDLVSSQSPVAPGMSVSGKLMKLIGPLKWSGSVDLRGYFPTTLDSSEDLKFTLQARTDLAVMPLRRYIPGLAIGVFADAYLFEGAAAVSAGGTRAPSPPPGAHLLLGVAITYDNTVRPPVRLR